MIDLFSGKFQTGANILGFQELIILQNLSLGHPRRQHIQHIFHPETIMANAGPATTLFRVKRDSICVFHRLKIASFRSSLKQPF